ncbi:MAG: hypothetical protein GX442_24260 [Candidatus Riflebacteria bacterium]|nr:hypothetical protein [Candidatus Riflebacteria bacterium]
MKHPEKTIVNPPLATRLTQREGRLANRLSRDGWSIRILAYHADGGRYLLARKGYLRRSYRLVAIDDLAAGADAAPVLATEERRFPPARRRRPAVTVHSRMTPTAPRRKILLAAPAETRN